MTSGTPIREDSKIFDVSRTQDLASVINRLAVVLKEEAQTLSEKRYAPLASIMDRKARCLLEMSRISRPQPAEGVRSLRSEIQEVLDLLKSNERLLAIHLEAATQLGCIVREVLADQSSDGTYEDVRKARR